MRTIRTKIVMAAHDAAGLTPPLPGLTPGAATQGEQMEISNTKQANRQMVKRGPEFMADIKKLADKEAGLTLQAVAEKHGLTRERIRQLFFILYGTPYTEAVNGKREHKKHIKLAAKIEKHSIEHRFRNYRKEGNHSKAVASEYKFYLECKSRGFKIYSHPGKSVCDFIVNNYFVDVKACHQAWGGKSSGRRYYHVSSQAKQWKRTDIYAVYIAPEDYFLIIPKSAIGHRGNGSSMKSIYIPVRGSDYCSAKNNYFEFRDAWHLLNTPPSDGPVSLEGDNLTRTPQSGNGDNAPDTVQLVPQVEAAQTSGKSAQEPPSRSAEMR